MSKRMFKVRGELDGQIKAIEFPMDATSAMIRQKFGEKFGCTVTGFSIKRPDGSCVPITSESQYQEVFREVSAVATCLNIEIKTLIAYQSPTKRPDPVRVASPRASSPRPASKPSTPAKANEVVCGKCGMKLPAGSRFCAGCGNALDTTPAATPTKTPVSPRTPATPKTPASPTAAAAAPASPAASDDPNMCPGCGKPAVGRTLKALGRAWHITCFKCTNCGKQIVGSFQCEDGKPYCAACYEDKFAERCAKCGKPLMGSYLFANEKPYHKECFVCSKCGKPFDGGYCMKNGEPICRECV